MDKQELDYIIKASHTNEQGTREITDVELYATSVIPPESAYPFLRTQARPRRGQKMKNQRWFKQGKMLH